MPEAVRMVGLRKVFGVIAAIAVLVFSHSFSVNASHIKSGDITWECLPSGQFVFRVKLFRDCLQQPVTTTNQFLTVSNYPGGLQIPLTLAAGYPIDRTDPSCGISCASPGGSELTYQEWLFESAPTTISGTPPANGYQVNYNLCCRGTIDNIANSITVNQYYVATMYPYNGNDMFPCYDSSPQFAELPTTALCAGYEMRYNNNAVDNDLDSLSYSLFHALGENAVPVTYESGFSANAPLPGPNPLTLNASTGQLTYQSSANVTGKWTVAIAVDGWRCGQRISRIIREMNVTIVACQGNNSAQITAPNWSAPAGASGYAVTVAAGDPVSFTLSATDNDMNGGVPQVIEFTAAGTQFAPSITGSPNNCIAPCATLSNVTPPYSGSGSISTTFDWQTSCDHVGIFDDCGKLTNTYNFLFTFKDNFCPARAISTVNVAVTVVGEPIVNSPDPHCVSTAANGDITLYWNPVTDNAIPPSFVEYVIYHSTSPNGPFQEVAAVANINTGTYQHTAANPVAAPTTSGPNFYLIRTRSGCNDAILEAPVDTVSSIFLTLNNSGTMAELSWTPVATPPLPSSNGNGQGLYKIYREYPAGTWTEVGTTFGLTYSEPIIWCNEWVNYRVELTDNLPCTSVSNVVGDLMNNPAQPEPQAIDSVSVDPLTGLVTVCWSPNPSTNVTSYNIYWNPDQFAWDLLANVQGYNTTCWTDSSANPSLGSIWYQVTATNNCGQESLPAGSGANGTNRHETIFLEDSVDGCAREAHLEWTDYWYWPEGVREYEVYSSKDGAPYEKIATVDDTIRSYIHESLTEEAVYCHYVRAVQENAVRITASSNPACSYVYVPKRPEYEYHYNTTVQPGNTGVENYWFVDSTAGYLGFEIQRGTDSLDMRYVWYTPYDETTRYYEYTDPNLRPDLRGYYYQIIGVDSCELYADTLNLVRTVFLEAEAMPDRTNELQWTPYINWRGGVAGYNIYRSIDGPSGPFDFLTSVPPTQLTYTDTVLDIIIGDGNFCYYIDAVEGIGNPVALGAPPSQISRSNEACARQHPNVFMPNAFMPEGVNNIFKPVSVYVNSSAYLFQVYNRWGGKVFETTDPDIGWNGGREPQGAYVYFVQFVSAKGDTYTKSGSVTLIR